MPAMTVELWEVVVWVDGVAHTIATASDEVWAERYADIATRAVQRSIETRTPLP